MVKLRGRLSERAHEDRKLFISQQPKRMHFVCITITESRTEWTVLNVVRRQRGGDPSAYLLDTGESYQQNHDGAELASAKWPRVNRLIRPRRW
jgi:hypothetical protein